MREKEEKMVNDGDRFSKIASSINDDAYPVRIRLLHCDYFDGWQGEFTGYMAGPDLLQYLTIFGHFDRLPIDCTPIELCVVPPKSVANNRLVNFKNLKLCSTLAWRVTICGLVATLQMVRRLMLICQNPKTKTNLIQNHHQTVKFGNSICLTVSPDENNFFVYLSSYALPWQHI